MTLEQSEMATDEEYQKEALAICREFEKVM